MGRLSQRTAAGTDPSRLIQHGALCFCVIKKSLRILLITSRGTGRWIVPKGWPIDGKSPAELSRWNRLGDGSRRAFSAGDVTTLRD